MTILRRLLSFLLVAVVVFAPALATVITIVFFGWRIIPAGLQTCALLAEQNLLSTMLYNNCGCAVVEMLLLLISAVALYWSTPRMIAHYKWVYTFQRQRIAAQRAPKASSQASQQEP